MEDNYMTTEEAKELWGKGVGVLKVRFGVKSGRIPGVCTENSSREEFGIPRYAFYRNFLCWNDEEIAAYHKSEVYKKYKKEPLFIDK